MAMKLEEKKRISADLSERLAEARTVYLTDFRGLDVGAMTEFRARLKSEGIDYRVVKNTLMRFALEGLDYPDIDEHLNGPTGIVLGAEDPVTPAKIVREFAGDHDERPSVKIGVVERRKVSAEEVERLAELPPKDELLGAIAAGLTAPVASIVGMMETLIRDIAHMVGQVAEENENNREQQG